MMKTAEKTETIYSSVLVALASIFIVTLSSNYAEAQASEEDPALAAASASGRLEAGPPPGVPVVTIVPSAPARAASAASAAGSASAPSSPASAASGATSSIIQPLEVPATNVTSLDEPPLSSNEFYGVSFATKNVDQISMSADMEPMPNPAFWSREIKDEGERSLFSKDKKQTIEFRQSELGQYEVITTNKVTDRATLTVFKRKTATASVPSRMSATSYTVLSANGEYTATPTFCHILKKQTQSESFADLGKKAVACNAFYKRAKLEQTDQILLQSHLNTHRANIETLRDSQAKAMVKDPSAFRDIVKNMLNREPTPRKPTDLLSKAPADSDSKERQIIAELGEACGRLWGDDDGGTKTVAPAPAKPAAPKGTAR